MRRVVCVSCDIFCKNCFASWSFIDMVDSCEKRAAVKFCFLFGNDVAKTVVILNAAWKENGKNLSLRVVYSLQKKRKSLLKINTTTGVLQLLEPTKVSEKFRNWFIKNDVGLLRYPGWRGAWCSKFYLRFENGKSGCLIYVSIAVLSTISFSILPWF